MTIRIANKDKLLIMLTNLSVSNCCWFSIYTLHKVSFSFRCIVIAVTSKIDVMSNILVEYDLSLVSRDRKRRMAAKWRPYALINRIFYLQ